MKKLIVLACLLISIKTFAFDTWWHAECTRKAMVANGFSNDARLAAQVSNYIADFMAGSFDKVNEVIEHINEVVEAGEKIVVFAWHREIVFELQKRIPGSVTVVGDNSMEERQQAVDSFQTDPKVQVVICNIKSGGVGER